MLVVRRGEWEAIEAEAPWNLEKGECTGTDEVRWLPDSHVSAHLFASTLNVKQLPGSTEHAQEGVGLADTVLPAMPAESLKLRPI